LTLPFFVQYQIEKLIVWLKSFIVTALPISHHFQSTLTRHGRRTDWIGLAKRAQSIKVIIAKNWSIRFRWKYCW